MGGGWLHMGLRWIFHPHLTSHLVVSTPAWWAETKIPAGINLGRWPSPHSCHQCTLVAEALVIIPVVTAMFRTRSIFWSIPVLLVSPLCYECTVFGLSDSHDIRKSDREISQKKWFKLKLEIVPGFKQTLVWSQSQIVIKSPQIMTIRTLFTVQICFEEKMLDNLLWRYIILYKSRPSHHIGQVPERIKDS